MGYPRSKGREYMQFLVGLISSHMTLLLCRLTVNGLLLVGPSLVHRALEVSGI